MYTCLPIYMYAVRDPGFYARPKRFPRPGVKHVRKMISGVTEVLDQPEQAIKQQCHMISAVYFNIRLQREFKPILVP